MKVVVASANPVKIRAVKTAFESQFGNEPIDLESLSVPSGVAEQPLSDEETRTGALNRAQAAAQAQPAADYWVGLEGGLEFVGGDLLASAWMVIRDAQGNVGAARTPTLPLPPRIQQLVRAGAELGDANDQVFGTHNSKQGSGAFGLLTGDRLTRESVYAHTLTLALIPLVHPLWDESLTGVAGDATR